jgi:hypothetical protein
MVTAYAISSFKTRSKISQDQQKIRAFHWKTQVGDTAAPAVNPCWLKIVT